MGKKDNKRFEIILEEKEFVKGCRILKDNETGVLYLFHYDGYAGGLTVMLDKEGKPLIDENE